jgi:hypothetical protein
MLGIPLGLVAANAIEWAFHKYVLHGLGRKKESFWSFHFHEHHVAARRNGHLDEAYAKPIWGWNAQSKEALALVGGCALATPLFPVAPFFTGTLWYSAINYYYTHKRAHLDPDWARHHLPWHFDHHMGASNANWCVTKPWFDWLLGTRRQLSSHTRSMRQKRCQPTR